MQLSALLAYAAAALLIDRRTDAALIDWRPTTMAAKEKDPARQASTRKAGVNKANHKAQLRLSCDEMPGPGRGWGGNASALASGVQRLCAELSRRNDTAGELKSSAHPTHSVCSMPTYPIWFATPKSSIVRSVRTNKTRAFARIIPGVPSTYVYETQAAYYGGYEEAYYAITMRKAGFECERHYEILARGAMPFFLGWQDFLKRPNVSALLPRDLITKAMLLPGVPSDAEVERAVLHNDTGALQIRPSPTFSHQYFEVAAAALNWTQNKLTTTHLAKSVLGVVRQHHGRKVRNILFISRSDVGYQSGFLYIGLHEYVPEIFWPVNQKHGVHGASSCQLQHLYGQGFSYCGRLPSRPPVTWSTIEVMRAKGLFDVIMYTNEANTDCDGVIHGIDYVPWVNNYLDRWPNTTVVYVDGNDIEGCHKAPMFRRIDLVFSREMICQSHHHRRRRTGAVGAPRSRSHPATRAV